MAIYAFDLDQTLCDSLGRGENYSTCYPLPERIAKVNELHEAGHKIIIYTARGMGEFDGDAHAAYNHYFEITKNHLKEWGVKHDRLILGKPNYDYFIDDKTYNADDWFSKKTKPTIGFVAGAFPVMHPGYVKMFKECKKHCDFLVVGLNTIGKTPQILSAKERCEMLKANRHVDDVIFYASEYQLNKFLREGKPKVDIRFLGEDYKDSEKSITGADLQIPIHYISREHGWSATLFKDKIVEQYKKKDYKCPTVELTV